MWSTFENITGIKFILTAVDIYHGYKKKKLTYDLYLNAIEFTPVCFTGVRFSCYSIFSFLR